MTSRYLEQVGAAPSLAPQDFSSFTGCCCCCCLSLGDLGLPFSSGGEFPGQPAGEVPDCSQAEAGQAPSCCHRLPSRFILGPSLPSSPILSEN